MIQATELRIGNWILTETNKPQKIHSIIGDRFNVDKLDGNDYGFPLTEMDPIPLTPAILEKAGFKRSPVNSFYVNNDMWLELTPLVTPIYCDGTGFRRYIGKHIKYLHQLQNLYFALTGDELVIKL